MTDIVKTLLEPGNGPDNYTLMTTAEADNEQDLVGLGNTFTLECYVGSTTEATIVWGGWGSNSTFFPKLVAAAGEEHGGVVGAGYTLISIPNSNNLRSDISFLVIEGLSFRQISTYGNRNGVVMQASFASITIYSYF